jgi:Phytanoyl-CoA dioxygenase (PhyH)
VDELADSTGVLHDPAALAGRLASDGYLFFRGLLPDGPLRAAGTAVTARLRAGGWADASGTPSVAPRAVNPREALSDPAFLAALTSAEFNRIPYLAQLRGLVRCILAPRAFSYPVKVLRAIYPERPGARTRGRYVHHDYAVAGVQDMLTSWVPLMDIPVRLGGLAVRPGGPLGPPRPPRPLGRIAPGWATTSYGCGDVIIFHCLTPHAALANNASELRLSGDFRWQAVGQAAPAELILGPARRAAAPFGRRAAGQPVEMFSRMFRREPWWEPVPGGLTLTPRAELAAVPPGPSGFFPVHPGWQRWHPPPGAVH